MYLKFISYIFTVVIVITILGCGQTVKQTSDEPVLPNPTGNITTNWKSLGEISTVNASFCDIIVVSPDIYVSYNDDDNNKIVTNKLVSVNWEAIGTPINSGNTASFIKLEMLNDILNIVFINDDNLQKANTYKYGSEWEVIDTADFSNSFAWDIDIAQVSDNHYIAYCDGNSGVFGITVNMLTSGNWTALETDDISAGEVRQSEIVSYQDKPCIAYTDEYYGRELIIKQFNGTAWNMVGDSRATDHEVRDITLLEENGVLYVSYVEDEGTYINKVSVMKYESGAWSYVGTRAFADAGNGSAVMTISNNQIYVVFNDNTYSGKLSVVKLNNDTWSYFGDAGFTSGSVSYIDIECYGDNVAVSYVDNDNKVKVVTYEPPTE